MWIASDIGFFSAVEHRDDPSQVLVRARCEEDIRNLAELVPGSVPFAHEFSDYEWRLQCSKYEWARVAAELSLSIGYANFKDHIREVQGPERASVYSRVWGDLLALERPDRFPCLFDGEGDDGPPVKVTVKPKAKGRGKRRGKRRRR